MNGAMVESYLRDLIANLTDGPAPGVILRR